MAALLFALTFLIWIVITILPWLALFTVAWLVEKVTRSKVERELYATRK